MFQLYLLIKNEFKQERIINMNICIVYGSTMGNTRSAAEMVQQRLGGELIDVARLNPEPLTQADLIILGTSTWGIGELQDDWATFMPKFNSLDLTGKKAAVFGLGDQMSYSDSYVDGMGLLAHALKSRGAELIGDTSTDGYDFTHSEAVANGRFVGLALDDDNQPDQTAPRIAAWTDNVKKAAGL